MKIKNSRKKAKKILSVVLVICWVCLIGYTGVYVYNNFLQPKKNQQQTAIKQLNQELSHQTNLSD